VRINQVISGEAVDRLADMLLLVGMDGSILDANAAALKCYGYSIAEIRALTIRDIRTAGDQEAIDRQIAEAGERGARFETTHRRSNGETFDVEVISAPVTIEGDTALLSVVGDITERKRSEAALQESEERYRSVVAALHDGVILQAANGTILAFNEMASIIFGIGEDDAVGQTAVSRDWGTVREDGTEWPASEHPSMITLATGEAFSDLEMGVRGPTGLRWILLSTEPMTRPGEPLPYAVSISFRDITARRQSEAALRESNEQFRTLADLAPVGIYLTDPQGECLYANPAWCRMAGLSLEDALGTGWLAAIHPEDRELVVEKWTQMVESHGEWGLEYRFLTPDGAVTTVYGLATPQYDVSGAVMRYVGVNQDVTERQRLEAGMQDMVTAVIDVVGNVSEMRDPYTAGHQRRVAQLSAAIAAELGMTDAEVSDIRIAGLMHDVGKMSIPAEILSKPTKLTQMEFELIKGHAEAGFDIIQSAHMEGPIAELVYQHHERCDGSGYPRGLTGSQLLEGSKVLMVADVAEAMMSHRPYRAALGQEAALAEIEQGAGRLYDVGVADACVRLFREQGFAFSAA
jgi:PAS domain S-box-containing protein/putative nucleotidyltransferase with HDIG domain